MAHKKLNLFFEEKETIVQHTSADTKKRKLLVCLMDELDYLLTRDFKVIYNFFNWPMQHEGFLLVAIANTMDLPERISSK
jgi:Cdc6-like AAA superfamily ATPase